MVCVTLFIFSGQSVFKKWKNVKDNFFKYLTKIKTKRSGSAASAIKKYHLFEQLTFLRKIAPAETQSSIATNSATQNQEEPAPEESPNENQHSIEINEPNSSKTSRRKRKPDEFETEVLNIIKNDRKEQDNRHLSFFKSLLPSLEKFNDQQVLQFQSRVLQIITEIQYPNSVWQNTLNYGYQSGYNTSTYDSYQSTPSTSSLAQVTSPISDVSQLSDETLPNFN